MSGLTFEAHEMVKILPKCMKVNRILYYMYIQNYMLYSKGQIIKNSFEQKI